MLKALLEAEGWEVFLDMEGIEVGDEWWVAELARSMGVWGPA